MAVGKLGMGLVAGLGGSLTPIGSASTLVAVTIMHKHAIGVSLQELFTRSRTERTLVRQPVAVSTKEKSDV